MTTQLPRFQQPQAVLNAIEAMRGSSPSLRTAVISYRPASDEWRSVGFDADVLAVNVGTKNEGKPENRVVIPYQRRLEHAPTDVSVEYTLAQVDGSADIVSLEVTVINAAEALGDRDAKEDLRQSLIGIFGAHLADKAVHFAEHLHEAYELRKTDPDVERHPRMRRLLIDGRDRICDIALAVEELEAGQLAGNNLQLMSRMFSDAPDPTGGPPLMAL